MSSTNRSPFRKVFSIGLSLLLLVSAVWLLLNRQFAYDQVSVWSYTPTAAIESIDERVAFTDKGTFMFYATRPEVANQEAFNTSCPRQEVGSPILGCYTGEGRIFIYDVTNEKLDGMKEVTAAHEMLHAAWQRLPESEKERLSKLLEAAYAKIDNPDLKTRMEYYNRTEPGESINELHSILGTEVPNLGTELEAHYAQYFDRQAVLKLYDTYSAQYKQLYGRADELFGLMETLGKSIESRLKFYESSSQQLTSDISAFNTKADNGNFSSMAQFYSERAALVSRSDQLESDRQSINSDVATYNSYHDEYESISTQIEVLNQSIDSFRTIDQTPSL